MFTTGPEEFCRYWYANPDTGKVEEISETLYVEVISRHLEFGDIPLPEEYICLN